MRVIIQRVNYTEISINNNVHSSISKGLLLLLGIEETDTPNDIDWLINKILHLRIFSDENALMNLSILDVQGDIMVVSQFTLFASTKKGTRPGFTKAAKPDFDPREHFRIENQINRDRPRVLQMPTQERPVLEDRATRERAGGTSFDRLLQSFNDNLARMVPDNAVQATVTDARQDNRSFPMSVQTTINQNIQQATQAPAAAAQATGQAVNSAVAGQAARIEQEPAF